MAKSQVAGLDPMAGQVIFFKRASEKIPSVEQWYLNEAIWRAAMDAFTPFRIPAGADTETWMFDAG